MSYRSAIMSEREQEEFEVADRARVEALLDEMARRLHAGLGERFVLVGLLRRGAPLARQLAQRLELMRGAPVPVGELKLKRYADDLSLLHETPELDEEPFDLEVGGATVVIVDDVLYTGRTLLRATNFLLGQGASRVAAAVLCSRGGQELPVGADVVGVQLDVGPGSLVDVDVPPFEERIRIVVAEQPE